MVRPKLPPDERRSEVFQIRLTKTERLALDRIAEAYGLTVADLLRHAALSLKPPKRKGQ